MGWRGVIEAADAPKLPDKFPSIADAVFPMYHVFRDMAEIANASIVVSKTSNALSIEVLVLKQGDKLTILLANMSSDDQTPYLNIPHGDYKMRRLNTDNAIDAMINPEAYRAKNEEDLKISTQSSTLKLSPYEYIRLQRI